MKPESTIGAAKMHGDFARGEREEPLTPESVEEGSFASEEK
jgi:hypothetical protein